MTNKSNTKTKTEPKQKTFKETIILVLIICVFVGLLLGVGLERWRQSTLPPPAPEGISFEGDTDLLTILHNDSSIPCVSSQHLAMSLNDVLQEADYSEFWASRDPIGSYRIHFPSDFVNGSYTKVCMNLRFGGFDNNRIVFHGDEPSVRFPASSEDWLCGIRDLAFTYSDEQAKNWPQQE